MDIYSIITIIIKLIMLLIIYSPFYTSKSASKFVTLVSFNFYSFFSFLKHFFVTNIIFQFLFTYLLKHRMLLKM